MNESRELSSDALLYIADYLDLVDRILGKLEAPNNQELTYELHRISEGKNVQIDLRRWAAELSD